MSTLDEIAKENAASSSPSWPVGFSRCASARASALPTRCDPLLTLQTARRQIDALQEIHQARGPMLLRVAFAVRDLWNGSQRSGFICGTQDALIRTPLLLERSGRQARKGT
jgi:hypothetical protein